ncbi:MAG: hypothetical protein AB7O71_10780 [Hyphomicrobiaceae bacterium]
MRKRLWILIPAMDYSLFRDVLKRIAWNFRDDLQRMLDALDELGKDPSQIDSRLYAYGLRAWTDRTLKVDKCLRAAIENDTCEEANRIRTLLANADKKRKSARRKR